MTIKQVVKILNKHKPKRPEDIERYLTLTHVGQGCYREAFAVKGSRVVLKFPYNTRCDVEHARNEIKAISKLQNAPPKIRKHAPKVYYTNWKTGVIAMKRYRRTAAQGLRLAKLLADFFQTGSYCNDFGCGNFAREGKKLIAIDLGIT